MSKNLHSSSLDEAQQWAISWPNEGYQVTKFEDADMSRLGGVFDTEREAIEGVIACIDRDLARMSEERLTLESKRAEFVKRIK